MDKVISQRELRNDSAAVLRAVQSGHSFTVTRNGTPVAELRPLPGPRFVPRSVIVHAGRWAPRVELARMRGDLDAIVEPTLDD
jgi:prevent-host-death family protein